MSQPVAWFDITAQDATTSRAFYGELFGWPVNVIESLDYGLVEADDGRLPGGIGQAGEQNPHPAGVVIYFPVEDVDVALARAESLGATCLIRPFELPGYGRMAVIADPDGNRVGIWQH